MRKIKGRALDPAPYAGKRKRVRACRVSRSLVACVRLIPPFTNKVHGWRDLAILGNKPSVFATPH